MEQFFILKSEPKSFSWDDLKKAPGKKTNWDGVRNYQARNYLRSMQKGDKCLFYHSSTKEPAIVGIVEVSRTAFPDPTAFDPESMYYDPQSASGKVRWYAVEVRFYGEFEKPILRSELKQYAELSKTELLRRGSRLSVIPLRASEFQFICSLRKIIYEK
ncbi:MAG: EVE domain-containing protein [Leptospiraceae bacterium]|nr:EVE domain-containing protein [Leptospiraceae bacterium]MDW8307117.1 EVE domain-containing protein [Leptospiraceae bacterium]